MTAVKLPKFKIPGEPDRYRLTATGTTREPIPSLQSVQFWFRTRLVSATGRAVDSYHLNVLRLRVDPSPLQQFIHGVVGFAPQLRQGKEEEHGDADELMDTEIRAYERLKPVQGVVVPVYYGQVRCNGSRSIIVQDVGGTSLREPEGMLLELDEFVRLLEECYTALISFGVNLEDSQLGNFILVDGKVMAVDLEMVSFYRTEDEMKQFMYMDMSELARARRQPPSLLGARCLVAPVPKPKPSPSNLHNLTNSSAATVWKLIPHVIAHYHQPPLLRLRTSAHTNRE
ncbi:hypothetical protein BHE90_012173 [Fusarium euwallaceae]|uniref:Protein kinase domain-containing protein n=1 Tax=Fusarium euwallaceae TaxID=1147111 RepID=A0A430LCJ5_9HYPO|nr:hypothetical protein BHE90_012173 [Fusarium euwallaceae]